VRGAFTNAINSARRPLLRSRTAARSSLDEIGDMSPTLQV